MKKERNPFKLDVVSIRLVKDTPLCSGYPINTPEDAVLLIGEKLCEMDREVVCVINMRADMNSRLDVDDKLLNIGITLVDR